MSSAFNIFIFYSCLFYVSLTFEIIFHGDYACNMLKANGKTCVFTKKLGGSVTFGFTALGVKSTDITVKWFRHIANTNGKITSSEEMGTFHIEWIPEGVIALIPCIDPLKILDLPENIIVKHTWTDSKGNTPEGKRFSLLHDGNLQIENIHYEDTDNYSCTLESILPRFKFPRDIFQSHHIIVFRLPRQSVIVRTKYKVKDCLNDTLTNLKLKIEEAVLNDVCVKKSLCYFTQTSLECNEIDKNADTQSALWKADLMLDPDYFIPTTCDDSCKVRYTDKQLTWHSNLMEDFFKTKGNLTLPQDNFVYAHDMSSYDSELDFNCEPGFGFTLDHCVSCMPGFYGNQNEDRCFPCPYNTFQPNLHTEACLPCPNGKSTPYLQATSENDCMNPVVGFLGRYWIKIAAVIFFIIFTPSKIFLLVYFVLVCFFPDHEITRKCKKQVKKICPCFFPSKTIKPPIEEYEMIENEKDTDTDDVDI